MRHLSLAVVNLVLTITGKDTSVNAVGALILKSKDVQNNRDWTPTVGRGYSHASGMMYSKCLDVPQLTPTTFDYRFTFIEIYDQDSISSSLNVAGHGALVTTVGAIAAAGAYGDSNNTDSRVHAIVGSMVMDRYYESADEAFTRMMPDAAALLRETNYISFIQTCGPLFVRGIRRSCELNAAFRYTTKSSSASDYFGLTVGVISAFGAGMVSTGNSRNAYALQSKLEVHITGRGLDLSNPAAAGLMVRSGGDMKAALDTGYQAMLNPRVGLVRSIEVTPWSNNLQFQELSELSMRVVYDETVGNETVSKTFPADLMRVYYIANAEHIAKMDEIFRYKFNMINHLTACMRNLWSKTSTFLCKNYVKPRHQPVRVADVYTSQGQVIPSGPRGTALADKEINLITAARLKYILEGKDQLTGPWPLLTAIADFKLFTKEYYGKCMKKLFETKYDILAGRMFLDHYINIDECKDVTCTMKKSYWDAETPGCALRRNTTIWENMVDNYCFPEYFTSIGSFEINC